MRIWLITPSEPLPIDSTHPQLMRTGLLAKELLARQHSVTWWTNAFNHTAKSARFHETNRLNLPTGLRLICLKSPGYRRNISLTRLRDQGQLAKSLSETLPTEPRPDLIVCSMPILDLAEKSLFYAKKQNIPFVLDLRDMWPDIFEEAVPSWIKPLARLATQGMTRRLQSVCAQSDALMAISPGFLSWGLNLARRSRRPEDRSFWLASQSSDSDDRAINEARAFLDGLGITDKGFFSILFAGVFSSKLDLETVIRAAHMLEQTSANVRFVMAGYGDQLESLRKKAHSLKNLFFPGYLSRPQIQALAERSQACLIPYRNRRDFLLSVPTKAAEALSYGLPLISSLAGETQKLIEEHQCGVIYSRTPDSLVHVVQKLARAPDLLKTLSENARRLHKEQFDASRVYGEMAEFLAALAERKLA